MQMIETLQPGDRLIVSELSRLGRSLGQILQIIDCLIQKQVRLVAIKEAIRFEGKQNIQTKAMIALFGLFAEVERDLIAQRTKEGLAAAKARGKRPGRPKGALSKSKLDGKEGEIRSLLQKRVSKASIARIMDVSQTTLHHFIKTRDLGVLKTSESSQRR
jgi:DNA invertase Pin-like site-specific DNA recombinase